MKKLLAVVCSAALMGASGVALAQTASKEAMTGSTAGKSMDFKKMDANNDGWVSRDEYLGFYGTRYDSMKRNEKGWVSWSDMERSDGGFFKPGTTSNTTNNPVTSNPGTKAGTGNPPATGGGSK
jgi:hypothetical protein